VTESGIPRHVEQFINDHINSVEQLEVLLLLHDRTSEEWTGATVARELYIDPNSAARRLADWRARGLLSDSGGAEPSYRFAPQDSELRRTVSDLARTYAERRVTVTNLIFSKPTDHISVFADAFRIRPKED
jgi:hypothetical protein